MRDDRDYGMTLPLKIKRSRQHFLANQNEKIEVARARSCTFPEHIAREDCIL